MPGATGAPGPTGPPGNPAPTYSADAGSGILVDNGAHKIAADFGLAAGQVAAGNHNHDVVYAALVHAARHTNGTDDIQDATAAQKGLATAAQIAKLDGIEPGATADQTPAEILAALLTVDGALSGLDADLLDGLDSSAFAAAAHNHDLVYLALSGGTLTGPLTLNTGGTSAVLTAAGLDRSSAFGAETFLIQNSGVGGTMTLQVQGGAVVANQLTVGGAAAVTGTLTVGGGTPIVRVLSATAALNFPNTGPGTSSDRTVTVAGAAVGDAVALGVPAGSVPADSCYTAWVSAADTVTVRFNNYSAGNRNPAGGTFRVAVIKF